MTDEVSKQLNDLQVDKKETLPPVKEENSTPQITPQSEKAAVIQKPGVWVKGISANPNGRPKGSVSLITILKGILKEERNGRTYAERLMRNLLMKALGDGGEQAHKLIMNYIEGLPIETIRNLNVDYQNLDDEELKRRAAELFGRVFADNGGVAEEKLRELVKDVRTE